jgi:hypothetical protein
MYAHRPLSQTKSGSSIVELEQHDATIKMPDPEFFRVHHYISQIHEVSRHGQEMQNIISNIISEVLDDDETGPINFSDVLAHFRPAYTHILSRGQD